MTNAQSATLQVLSSYDPAGHFYFLHGVYAWQDKQGVVYVSEAGGMWKTLEKAEADK